jgi:hypothetical protein
MVDNFKELFGQGRAHIRFREIDDIIPDIQKAGLAGQINRLGKIYNTNILLRYSRQVIYGQANEQEYKQSLLY